MPVPSLAGAPTPSPAPEGGKVLAAGRAAQGPAAKSRTQPQAPERTGVSDAVKGTLRRAAPALDRALNARNAAGRGDHACVTLTGRSSSVPYETTYCDTKSLVKAVPTSTGGNHPCHRVNLAACRT